MRTSYSSLIIIYIATFVFSCASSGKIASKGESSSDTDIANNTDSAETTASSGESVQAASDSIFAGIERGACYGNCPTYKMYIYQDGTVKLKGIRAIDLIGHYQTTITSEQMQEFTDMALFIEYMSLDDEYDGPITDIPGTLTTIVIDGKKKSVYRRYQYPKRILKFEELFDNLLESEEWEKVEVEED